MFVSEGVCVGVSALSCVCRGDVASSVLLMLDCLAWCCGLCWLRVVMGVIV